MKILVINPGSTSTKLAVFEDEQPILERNICHSADELSKFEYVDDQQNYRRDLLLEELERTGLSEGIDAVIARGGLVKPIEGGTYHINEKLLSDTHHALRRHACNLGCPIAVDMADRLNIKLRLTADPGVVDERCDEAHLSGLPQLPRIAIWHALNQKAIARRYAGEHNTRYENLNLIICHMGGGISVAAHQKGRAIDANNALDGEGSFAPDRAGSLPARSLVEMCFGGEYTHDEIVTLLSRRGGLVAHLGTNNVREIIERIEQGDEKARKVVDAMIFNISKSICSETAVLCGPPDAILLTGGAAHSTYLTERIKQRVGFLAPVTIYPGENEMLALAQNALAVLRGEQQAKNYQ